MKLHKVTFTNFRCYSKLELTLHEHITVLAANNGKGKSAILDGIRIILWPYVSQFDLARGAYADPANTITIDDVKAVRNSDNLPRSLGSLGEMARQLPASIDAEGVYDKVQTRWGRYRDSESQRSQTKDDSGTRALKKHTKRLQHDARDLSTTPGTLPVFGYYGTGRLWKEKRLTESKKGSKENTDEQIRTFAYRDCLDPASSFRQFQDWFTSAYLKVLENQIKQLEDGATFIEVPRELRMPVKVVQDAVNEVLKPVGWQHLQYSERYDKSLVLSHPEYGVMKISQLSDGIKNMLAMIADIAYRAVLLNGHLNEDAAKKSPGVVMIDEVDMHLHPMWQQTVIGSLRNAFPEIQFIVTTHSPQVLSTVKAECIRLIEHSDADQGSQTESLASTPSSESKGVASAELMAKLQLVDPIPNVPEANWVSTYRGLITQGLHTTTEGQKLKSKILKHFGEEHPSWKECSRLIRLYELKKRVKDARSKE